jgi:hypothetical protein
MRLRLGVIDRQRYAALHRPAEGEHCRAHEGGSGKGSFSCVFHELSPLGTVRKEHLLLNAEEELENPDYPEVPNFARKRTSMLARLTSTPRKICKHRQPLKPTQDTRFLQERLGSAGGHLVASAGSPVLALSKEWRPVLFELVFRPRLWRVFRPRLCQVTHT